jgi:hypothetical protein
MSTFEIITTVISILALVVSSVALWRDILTRKKVDELRELEIEKLKYEKESQSKAVVYGYIDDDYFIIENSGEAPASNIRYEGWDDWCDNISKNIINYLPPHHSQSIKLYLTMDSPNSKTFKITWDDESGKDHVWSETLNLEK